MLEAIDNFCQPYDGFTWKDDYMTGDKSFSIDVFNLGSWLVGGAMPSVEMTLSGEVRNGCTWHVTRADCTTILKKAVNDCDTKGEGGKHGGIVRNDCLVMRIDPNVRYLSCVSELC
jgi:hypothetical protein